MKAKLKACRTEEEMLKVLEEEKIELDPELLDAVSGGNPLSTYYRKKACPCEDKGLC